MATFQQHHPLIYALMSRWTPEPYKIVIHVIKELSELIQLVLVVLWDQQVVVQVCKLKKDSSFCKIMVYFQFPILGLSYNANNGRDL